MPYVDRALRSNIKLRHLQLLVALDEYRHLGRTAELMSVSQPAVSKMLVEIEEMLGLQLFDRSRRGTEPTPAGLTILRFARSVIADYERVRDEVNTIEKGAAGRVRVGSMVAALPSLLAPAVEWKQLVDSRFVVPPLWASMRVKLEQQFFRDGVTPAQDVVESASFLVQFTVVRDQDAIALMASSVARHFVAQGLLSVLPLRFDAEIPPVGIITIRDRKPTPITEKLIDQLRAGAELKAKGKRGLRT